MIVGCGRLGSRLANELSSQGHRVVVIDPVDAAFDKLSTEFSGFRILGDASESTILQQARIEEADCLVATTRRDNVNLMVAQVAKVIYEVPTVLARVFNPSREAVYREFGIETICPTNLVADAFLAVLRGDGQDGGSCA